MLQLLDTNLVTVDGADGRYKVQTGLVQMVARLIFSKADLDGSVSADEIENVLQP